MKWEEIDEYHQRAKVFGGWIVKAYQNVVHNRDGLMQSGWDWRASITFVPDPKHEWKLL